MGRVFTAANYANINTVPSLIDLNTANMHLTAVRIGVWQHVASTDLAKMTELEQKITENLKSIESVLAKYEKDEISDDKDRQLLALDRETLAKYVALKDRSVELSRAGKNAEARDLLLANQTVLLAVGKAFQEHYTYNVELGQKAAKEALNIKGHATLITLLVALAAVLLVSGISFSLTRRLLKQLAYGGKVAQTVAAGDLSIEVAVESKDEVGIMLEAQREMVKNLRHLVSQAVDISAAVASASNQLRATSDQIATGAEEVVAQTNTVATASEEMAATSSDIARNCSMAADASQRSTEAAHTGAGIVQETITGMGHIAAEVRNTSKTIEALGARSNQIGEIVGTIEDIADQTNLLALNAAIEAARAGEQGRGFAVVADEVRALAERTTRATREIGEMIKGIQAETRSAVQSMVAGVVEVEKGTEASARSGQALEEILASINEVSLQVSQIATAAEEQTATTSEVTNNIVQITEVVQQTACGAEETAAAAGTLANQAQELKDLVGRFRL